MTPYRHKTTETIIIGNDLIVVQQGEDIESNKKHIKSGGCWIADWVGSQREGISGESREEVIKKMCELIGITASGADAVKFCIAHNDYVNTYLNYEKM